MAKIALVGHCGPDAYMLRSSVKYVLKDSEIVMVNDTESLNRAIADGADVLLINRILEYGMSHRQGVDLIRDLKQTSPQLKMILISDFPDAQADAEKAGALPGFGKSEVGSAKMKQSLAGLEL